MEQHKYALIVPEPADFLNGIVARFDAGFRYTYVNSADEHLRPLDLIGKNHQELGMPPDLAGQWDEALACVFRTGQPRDVNFTLAGPNASRDFHARLIPEKTPSGQVASVIAFSRAAAQTGPAVSGNHCTRFDPALSQVIMESIDDAVVSKTLDGFVTNWNAAAESLFGYKAEEMLGQSVLRLFPPELVEEENLIIERLRHGTRTEHFETVRLHKSGRRVHVTVTTTPIRNAMGDIIGAYKIARNIMPLMAERERLQLALDTSSNGLWDWDLKTGMVYRSDHYLKITGYAPEEDTRDFEFFRRTVHPGDLQQVLQNIEDYCLGKLERIEFDYRLVTKSGCSDSWVTARGQAVERDLQGRPTRMVGTLTDITHSKRIYANLLDREKRLTRVIDGSDQGYWDWNIQTNSLEVSPRWARMLGYTIEELDVSDGRFEQYVHPKDFVSVMEMAHLHIAGKLPNLEAEIRCRNKSGEWTWILTRGRVVEWDEQGIPLMVSGTHTDITERKILEMSQRDAATVFDNSYEGIMVVNPKGLITRINPAFSRITGYAAQEVLGQSHKLLSFGLQDRHFYKEMYLSLAQNGYWTGEIWSRRKDGQIYTQLLSVSSVVDDRLAVEHYIGIFSDISQRKEHEAELDRVAHYDPLTGTPNRRLLADRLQQSILKADRHQKNLAVCYIDLDGFKEVNDTHGHKAGDELLIGISNRLKRVLRSEDTLSRLGGDEFVLLLYDIGTPEECAAILDRILNAIKAPLSIETAVISVSGSIGMSLYPLDHSDADSLLRHADQAMYRAKEAGKNRYHLFDLESDQKAQHQRRMVKRLHVAMQCNEFRLHYQPKVDLRNGAIAGMEALIRWQHPQQGLLSPAAFLPHVEGSTVDYPLGKWVISSALQQAALWLRQGSPIKVSVNIGAGQLLQPEFLNDLRAALADCPDLPPDHLELEVLESVSINDLAHTVRVLTECRQIGVALALDDFGTGYSSLTYLRTLPVDTLKIDQSFICDMLTDPEDHGIVEAVIRLAGAFNRQVIAEGVETLAHGAALLQMGCHLAQGYGIAKPMADSEVLAWVREWTAARVWEKIQNTP